MIFRELGFYDIKVRVIQIRMIYVIQSKTKSMNSTHKIQSSTSSFKRYVGQSGIKKRSYEEKKVSATHCIEKRYAILESLVTNEFFFRGPP